MAEYVDPQMSDDDVYRMLDACHGDSMDYDALDAILVEFVTDSQRCAEVITTFTHNTALLVRRYFADDIEVLQSQGREWMFSLNPATVSRLPVALQTAMQLVGTMTNQDQDMYNALLITHVGMGEDHAVEVMSAAAYVHWMLYTRPENIGVPGQV
jgi:hypothetical protein